MAERSRGKPRRLPEAIHLEIADAKSLQPPAGGYDTELLPEAAKRALRAGLRRLGVEAVHELWEG